MPITAAQWQKWLKRLEQELTEGRYNHCLRVAEAAAALACHYGMDEEKARLAGLLHDVARDIPTAELLELAARYGLAVGPEEQASPIILHAPVGAAILRREWQIEDEAVLTAVARHTVAAPGMDAFCQVLYLADLIEPGRKKWPELPHLRRLCYQDLGQAMVEALEGNFRYLNESGLFIHPQAAAAREFFGQQINGQERA